MRERARRTDRHGSDENHTHVIQVPTIDLAKWLSERFYAAGDFVYLKVDIEGAESGVFEHLLDTRAVDLVDYASVETEWHTRTPDRQARRQAWPCRANTRACPPTP